MNAPINKHLFRKEVIDQKKEAFFGEVKLNILPSMLWCTLFIVVWFMLFVAWIVTGHYTKKESVKGWLEPKSGVVKLYPPTSVSEIHDIFVKEGELVEAGQPLVKLRHRTRINDGSLLQDRHIEELASQRNILLAEKDRSVLLSLSKKDEYKQEIKLITEQKHAVSNQIEIIDNRIKINREKLENLKEVAAKGYISKNTMLDLKQFLLTLESDRESLLRAKSDYTKEIMELENLADKLPAELESKIGLIDTDLSKIVQSISEFESDKSQIITASTSGVVSNLQGEKGQIVFQNTPLLSLVPSNDVLVANLLVPVKAVGFVKENQTLKIHYDAFAFQKFGSYKATIRTISDSLILNGELKDSPITFSEPVYLVKAEIESNAILAYGNNISLKSGMTFTADISLGKRSLMEWILDPMISLKGQL